MNKIPDINLDEYDYHLSEERIAQYPAEKRDHSKLLIYNKGMMADDLFKNIHNYLPADSLMVINDTRVIRARIIFRKETGAIIEIFCLEPLSPMDYQQAFSAGSPVEFKCIVGNLKKWKQNPLRTNFNKDNKKYTLTATKISSEGEAWRIRFSWDTKALSFAEVIESAGHIPLPPYVKRDDEEEDNIRYQTVYSKSEGSVAAPTAGLHFTDTLLNKIKRKGIRRASLTLHVGAGTFKPVKTNDVSQHEMHCEHFFIHKQVIEALLTQEGKIISVGTTCVRALESLYYTGVQILNGKAGKNGRFFIDQWEYLSCNNGYSAKESLSAILAYMDKAGIMVVNTATRIMIIPGYNFHLVDAMITNFHMPKSTLLLLVSAWTGEDWKEIYNYALNNDFRFLSYGDSSLLL